MNKYIKLIKNDVLKFRLRSIVWWRGDFGHTTGFTFSIILKCIVIP